MSNKNPKKAIEVTIRADGFDWDGIIEMLEECVQEVRQRRERSGGFTVASCRSSSTAVGLRNVTRQEYLQELRALPVLPQGGGS